MAPSILRLAIGLIALGATAPLASAQFTEEQQRTAIAIDDYFYRQRLSDDRRFRDAQRSYQLQLDQDRRRYYAQQQADYQRQVQEQEYNRALESYYRRAAEQERALQRPIGREYLYLKNPTPENIAKAKALEQKARTKPTRPTNSDARSVVTVPESERDRDRSPEEIERARKQLVQEHLRQLKQSAPRTKPSTAKKPAKKKAPKRAQARSDDDDDDDD